MIPMVRVSEQPQDLQMNTYPALGALLNSRGLLAAYLAMARFLQ